jgi:hypothetical protein
MQFNAKVPYSNYRTPDANLTFRRIVTWPRKMTTRYLTKSRFTMGLECPTKLHFTGKREFANSQTDDTFLQTLADGGFQVGELAKLMYPGAVEVREAGHEEALRRTDELLLREEVTIFEAAVRYGTLFVRIDILKKRGNRLDLIEVKARSYDAREGLRAASGSIKSGMLPYLHDVAFQVFVLRAAFPTHPVSACLLLADKSARATADGLNQRFKIIRDGARHHVEVAPGTSAAMIGAPLLALVPVDDLVDELIASPLRFPGGERLFADTVDYFSRQYQTDRKIDPVLGAHCAKCEFRTPAPSPQSGFHTCWKQVTGWNDKDFAGGTVLDIWNFRRKDELIGQGVFGLGQVNEQDLKPTTGNGRLSRSQRQWMQVSRQWPGGGSHYLDRDGLRAVSAGWRYPLHFIDFETSRTAIPFHAGRTPYEQVAFQFSHHVMLEDGTVEHAGQFLQTDAGVFPNYAFVRELRRQLAGDDGTILRWATHENSVLRDIFRQLDDDPQAPPDKETLQAFILDITSEGKRVGQRSMVDLCQLAEHHYFHPATKGSSSIKKVLPAVFGSCTRLREKYSRPDYGSPGGIPSLNFRDWAWWRADTSGVSPRDPYSLLPTVSHDIGDGDGAADEELANGGAAMAAYARLQFEKLGNEERRRLSAALLKYCELDTLAMAMIWESWR